MQGKDSKDFIDKDKEKWLLEDNAKLRAKLQESEEILYAISTGAVDALTIQGPAGPQIFTIKGADHTYRILIEKMNEGALTLNSEAIILFCNSKLAEFLHFPLERVIGSSIYTFLLEKDHAYFKELFDQGWQRSSKGEFVLKTQDGKVSPFSISMNSLNPNDAPSLGVIVTDLSAEKEIIAVKSQVAIQNQIIFKKEEELLREKQTKEEAERFRIALEGIPQIAWTSTPDGKVNYTNLFWHEYSGYSFEQTEGNKWESALHPDDKERTVENIRNCLVSGIGVNLESRLKRGSDGTYRCHIVRALPVRNSQNQIILWVYTCTDIQDQKEATEKIAKAKHDLIELNYELREKNEQLIRTNNDLDTFIYTASHDLKSPVMNIEGLIRALEKKMKNEGMLIDGTEKFITMINLSIQRFRNTIQDLTEIAKVQKTFQEETAFLNFEEIIEDVKSSIHELISDSNAHISVDTTLSPEINISRKNLKSIIYNLISNAIKYCSTERPPEIEIRTEKIEDFTIMVVKDNGIGMDPNNIQKIFSLFKRLHSHVEGTGIGLYIVKRIIDNMGGKIEVESTVGEGSTFKIYFKS